MLARMRIKITSLRAEKESPQEREVLRVLAAGLAALEGDEKRFVGEPEEGEKEDNKDNQFFLTQKEKDFYCKLYVSAYQKFSRAFIDLMRLNPAFSLTELEDERILLAIHLEVLKQPQLSLEELINYRNFKRDNANGLQIDAELKAFIGMTLNPAPLTFEHEVTIDASRKNISHLKKRLKKEIKGFEKTSEKLKLLSHKMAEELKDQEKIRELQRQRANIVCLQQGAQNFTLFEKPRQTGEDLRASIMPK